MALKSQSSLFIFAFLVASALVGVSTAFSGRKAMILHANIDDALAPDVDGDVEIGALPPGSEAPLPGLDIVALNTNDPKVVELATFALDTHNKEAKDSLKFVRVLEAVYRKRDGGKSYGFVIAATGSDGLDDYDAKLWVGAQNDKKLLSFDKNE